MVDVNYTADNTGTNINSVTSHGFNLKEDEIHVHIVRTDKSIDHFFHVILKNYFLMLLKGFKEFIQY